MEKRLNKKLDDHVVNFKDNIRKKCIELGIHDNNNTVELLNYIYNYDNLSFTVEDLQKRKRIKNIVPKYDRCCAKRANGEQCTRKRKNDYEFCGTHTKGTPHGYISSIQNNIKEDITEKVEVWAQDIKGILYYIDNKSNVYKTEDIINNKINPCIIAKYTKVDDNYSIPEFNI